MTASFSLAWPPLFSGFLAEFWLCGGRACLGQEVAKVILIAAASLALGLRGFGRAHLRFLVDVLCFRFHQCILFLLRCVRARLLHDPVPLLSLDRPLPIFSDQESARIRF